MKISELKVGAVTGEIRGEIIDLESPREVMNKYGVKMKVASGTVRDDSGEIKISLWNDDATKFKVGDKVVFTNGWVSEFKGTKQLSAGKSGKIEKA
ncbi:MAG: OB-fold nucleic acid binding domain-containing protein [Candidatus Micrarchaeota archaeon]|nr:OB-fold nucleic acid binding domain-containing protein [Candidatus Micrarchaeota archaeon]